MGYIFIILNTPTPYKYFILTVLPGATVDKTDLSASDGISSFFKLLVFGAELAVGSPIQVILILTIFQFFFWASFFATLFFLNPDNEIRWPSILKYYNSKHKDEAELPRLLTQTGLHINHNKFY